MPRERLRDGWWVVGPVADADFHILGRRAATDTKIGYGRAAAPNLSDDRIFGNPWIWRNAGGLVQDLNDKEVARLHEYLLRDGFLVVDDFWSQDPDSWPVFERTMARTLPGHPITQLAESDLRCMCSTTFGTRIGRGFPSSRCICAVRAVRFNWCSRRGHDAAVVRDAG